MRGKLLNFKPGSQETIGDLLKYHNEILQTQGSVYAKFFRSKISEFHNNNGLRINTSIEKIKALHAKYYEMDEKGERKIAEKELPLPEGAPEGTKPQVHREYVLLEGMTVEKYREEYAELMNQPCNIVW